MGQRSELESIEESVGIDEPDGADVAYAGSPMRSTGGVDFSEATARLDTAIALGEQLDQQLQEVAALAPTAGVNPPELASIEGVDDFAGGIAATDGQLEAMMRIIEVENGLDDATGLFATVGGWGSDIESDLTVARSQVERGDTDAALATLDAAGRRIDGLTTAGQVRLLIAAVVLVVLFVAIVVVARSRRAARVKPLD